LPPTLERVHRTQLYECAALLLLMALLIYWRRQALRDREVLGRYLLIADVGRFTIEFVRVDPCVIGPFAVAHVIAAAVDTVGAWLVFSARRAIA
jgi:prolipoprotein diacylglyceryltransferase